MPGATEAEASLRAGYEATLAMLAALGAGLRRPARLAATAPPPATAARSAGAAPGRTRSRTTSSSSRATCSSPRRARRSGATTPSSSAAMVDRPADGRACGGSSTTRVAAQQAAFDAIRPGATCADVDRPSCDYFAEHDLLPLWRQHTGHAIGLRNHEAPFLDVGDHTPLEPGMVFTIEPGVYDGRARRLPPLGHGRRHRGRHRDPHRLPARPREPDHPGLTSAAKRAECAAAHIR